MAEHDDDIEQLIAVRRERIETRRQRQRERPLVVRALVALVGSIMALAAAPIAVVLPEFGVPLLVAALSILALEFTWAVGALVWVIRTWERIKRWYRGLSGVGKATVWIVAVGILLGLAEWTRRHYT